MKLKDRASFFSFFLRIPMYEVCLMRIKEQVGKKRSTVCTHRYVDCLLKNTSTKHNKYVVNQKLEHVRIHGAFGRPSKSRHIASSIHNLPKARITSDTELTLIVR